MFQFLLLTNFVYTSLLSSLTLDVNLSNLRFINARFIFVRETIRILSRTQSYHKDIYAYKMRLDDFLYAYDYAAMQVWLVG